MLNVPRQPAAAHGSRRLPAAHASSGGTAGGRGSLPSSRIGDALSLTIDDQAPLDCRLVSLLLTNKCICFNYYYVVILLIFIFIFIHRKGCRTNSLTNLTKQQTQYVKAVNLHLKLATRFRHKSLGISNEKHS